LLSIPPEIYPLQLKNINENLGTLSPTLGRLMPGLLYKIPYKKAETVSGSALGTPGGRHY
jgi:hypothetical protein